MLHKDYLLSKENISIFACEIAQTISKKSIICISGEFGVGKTYLSREIIKHTDSAIKIVDSPSFNIVNIYNTKKLDIYHYDLYRVKNYEEIQEIGIEHAYENGAVLIEWPELIINFLPRPFTYIKMSYNNGDNRNVSVNELL